MKKDRQKNEGIEGIKFNKQKVLDLFNDFISKYDIESKEVIWSSHSKRFRIFWNTRILSGIKEELNDSEIDEIVRILDKNAKGSIRDSEAVAKVMIPQGVWRKMFREIKNKREFSTLLNKIFIEQNDAKKIKLIDELYKLNENNKNSLTGKSGNALNTLLFVYDPSEYVSVVSLNDRCKIVEYFGFAGAPDFDKDMAGKKIVLSNYAIINGFQQIGIDYPPRTICDFLYNSPIKTYWKTDSEDDYVPWGGLKHLKTEPEQIPGEISDPTLFYMESQLEDFLIENWDRTDLGKKYDLIEENGEIVSQQYRTGIGKIDILVQDKKSKQLVVIELKKNQTNDDTIGQLARYMGWLEGNKTNGKSTKGIIIAAQFDDRLYYALKKLKDTEVYLYRVDFKLTEFKK